MSVSANIVIKADPNVLVIPASAVHTASDGSSYVLAFDPPLATSTLSSSSGSSAGVTTTQVPVQIPVAVAASNNTQVEIASGLTDGEQIIARTVTGTAARSAVSSSGGSARIGGGGGGGFIRQGL